MNIMEEAADNRDYDASHWGTDSPTAQDAYLAQRVGFPDASSDTPAQDSEYDASEHDSDAGSVFGFTGSSNFKVVIRIRPPLERELTGGKQFQNTVMVSEGHRVMTISENLAALTNRTAQASEGLLYSTHQFTFDYVYGQDSTQKSVYDHSAKDAVMSTLTGYNATIIAYGQTGTGKTYTMEGAREGETRGIIPRSIEYIFDYIENDTSASRKYLVRAAYLQIYNEVISDLLKPERTNLSIREEKRRGIFVEGLSEWVVRSPAEIYGLMERGAAQRAVGSTRMNEISSRSHAVFIIIAENVTVHGQDDDKARMPKPASNGQMSQSFKVGKLNLVDLAGSERVRLTGATGRRLEESKKINQSLSALGNVISALTDARGRQHIPYRDSKLTRILEDSLGGNCKTTMMAMISPALEAFQESLSTLKFANRAKNIKNEAHVNEDLDQKTLLLKYEHELRRLRQELEQRSKNLVDKRRLLEAEEQKRRAEEDKLAAITELQNKSHEFMREKAEKRKLEERINSLQSQLLIGGHKIEDTPAFRTLLQQEHRRIRNEYERRLRDMERERQSVEEDKAQVDRYKQVLLKQRDIMIALTARLNERDEQIIQMQDELEAYDSHQRVLEDALDQKTSELIALRKAAMEHASSSPMKNLELQSALGMWGSTTPGEDGPPSHVRGTGAIEVGASQGGRNTEGQVGPERLGEYVAELSLSAPGSERFATTLASAINRELKRSGAMHAEDTAALQEEVQRLREDAASSAASSPRVPRYDGDSTGGGLEPRVEALKQQNNQFRQEMAARLDEKNQLIKRYDEEIQRLRASANSRSSAETTSLRDQCANHAKERAALKTILESKIRTLVDGIGRSVQELPEAQQHPRLTREVQALDKLVNATVNAMRTTSTPSSTSEASQ